MKEIFKKLKSAITEVDGTLLPNQEQIVLDSIENVQKLCNRMIGATLVIREKQFVIRMLEIYYGSIGDDAHDWHRTKYKYKKSKYKDHILIIEEEGFKIYINSLNPDDTYRRFDIVVGNKGVAVSFLVRSVWDINKNRIGSYNGNPNIVLNQIGLTSEDHSSNISNTVDAKSDIKLLDTHKHYFAEWGLKIEQKKRIGVSSKFEENNSVKWNFYAN